MRRSATDGAREGPTVEFPAKKLGKTGPSNRLEKLKGHLSGFHSIRINDQWRTIFKGK
jgi:plasmid maintenance system killer protein